MSGFARGTQPEDRDDVSRGRHGDVGQRHQAARVAAQGFGEAHHPFNGEAARAAFELVDLCACRAAGLGQMLQGPAALLPPEFDAIRYGHAYF